MAKKQFSNLKEEKLKKEIQAFFIELGKKESKKTNEIKDKKDNKENKEVKETQDKIEISFEECFFSLENMTLLAEYLKKCPNVVSLKFKDCEFSAAPNTNFRNVACQVFDALGAGLVQSQITHFTLEHKNDASATISADATMVFADYVRKAKSLRSVSFDTGTRGTVALCRAIEDNGNVVTFVNSLLKRKTSGFHNAQQQRNAMFAIYEDLQKKLEQRQKPQVAKESNDPKTAGVKFVK